MFVVKILNGREGKLSYGCDCESQMLGAKGCTHAVDGIVLADQLIERKVAMIKNLESLSEIVRNPKHAFRKSEFQPKKQLRHRHERRKIREVLHTGDWMEEEPV